MGATRHRCICCSHPEAKQLNIDLASGVFYDQLARQYSVSTASISKHARRCLRHDAAKQFSIEQAMSAFDFGKELHKLYKKSLKFLDAFERWLSDPDNPDEYYIGPRDAEIMVIYMDWNDKNDKGEPIRKKGVLSDLLQIVSGSGREVMAVQSMAMDNRKLYLESFKMITDRLEQIAKFMGYYKTDEKKAEKTEIERLKQLIIDRATQKGIPFKDELRLFLDRYATDRLRPEVKAQLISELEQ